VLDAFWCPHLPFQLDILEFVFLKKSKKTAEGENNGCAFVSTRKLG
jgi:hypothetical protein